MMYNMDRLATRLRTTAPGQTGASMAAETGQDSPARLPGLDVSCAGKWVAVVHGRVAAVGETAQQARLLARQSFPKDEAIVLRIPAGGLQAQPPESL
jgi:hypothetical protein